MWLPKDREIVVVGTDRVTAETLARSVTTRAWHSRQSGVLLQDALVSPISLLVEQVRLFLVAAECSLFLLLLFFLFFGFSRTHAELEVVDFLSRWDQP